MDIGHWSLIEPLMSVEVVIPVEYQSAVLAGLNKRKALILGQDSSQTYSTLECEVSESFTDHQCILPSQKCMVDVSLCYRGNISSIFSEAYALELLKNIERNVSLLL